MKLYAPLALALCLTAATRTTSAQTTQPFTDPANLRGERVAPLNGHELPIDKSEVQGGRGLQQLLRKLNTRASLMLIVAHPDDEDGGMLTLYSRGLGARVADLALNRGEGGQNAMTGDFEDALGLIRTQELLSADRYFDASQMFGTEVDFGFSKTKEESFAKWTHQRVLYDVVRAIRLYRPLVIASVFIGGVTDGHGQHQVSGEIAQEAFVAAADPKVFPELTAEGILPWAPLKVYARVPRQAVTAQGLFDYATNQYTPARFTNYVTGAVTTTLPSTDVIIHEGATDPLLTPAGANPADLAINPGERDLLTDPTKQLSYVQFARIGLGLQRSQIGPGTRLPPPGAFDIAYHLYGSRLCNAPADARPPSTTQTTTTLQNCHSEQSEEPASLPEAALQSARTPDPSFFTGIDTSLDGILSLDKNAPLSVAAWEHITRSIAEAQKQFDLQHPARIAPLLADALANIDLEIDLLGKNESPSIARANVLHELRIKRVQLNDALVLAYGIEIDATSEEQDVLAHHAAVIQAKISARGEHACLLRKTWLQNAAGVTSEGTGNEGQSSVDLSQNSIVRPLTVVNRKDPFNTAFTSTLTKPYFFRNDIEQAVYSLLDLSLRNAPQSPPAFTAYASVSCGNATLQIGRIANFAYDDQPPMEIVPNLNIWLATRAKVLPLGTPSFAVTLINHSFGSRAYPTDLCLPTGCMMPPGRPGKEIDSTVYKINVPKQLWGTKFDLTTKGFSDDQTPSGLVTNPEGYSTVGYPGLIPTNYYRSAIMHIVPVDLTLPPPDHRRIAYLPGTGDAVPEALASIGLAPTILTVADLTPTRLAKFDTVILGVRTYNAHPDLHGAPTQALLDYTKNGGNVLVQYQTYEFTAADAPYPLTLGTAEKVVDETAPVKLLDTQSPLLTTPNVITSADFNAWIEERGHGFLHTWDPRYTALTETHDPGGPETAAQLPQLGGLITTPLGRGRWTYCAFALYRQLPEAVPGAYRLFVNLLNNP